MIFTLTFVLATLQQPQPSQPVAQPPVPTVTERVEVVATRLPEQPLDVPAAIEVLSGEDLRSRGAADLATALGLAGGVSIAPGGDNGPAAAVPEFWGLREFDAFLLVVDGVPWGGAFNPALSTLSLIDVERVEILRGPAPVTYGATSFVGVIHVVHRGASAPGMASVRAGSFGSGGAAMAVTVPLGGWQSRLAVDVDRQGFSDDRTSFRRAHALWRNVRGTLDRRVWFNVDAAWVDQDPASPHLREGRTLSARTPIDANYNPSGAFLNDRRLTGMFGFDRPLHAAAWTTTASFSLANQDVLRGFLGEIAGDSASARGIREKIDQTDLYVDSHLAWSMSPDVRVVAGADFLHGMGDAKGETFDYIVPLAGQEANANVPSLLGIGIEDRREFFGGYGLMEWSLLPRLRVSGGLRLNATVEERDSGEEQGGARPAAEKGSQSNVRPSGNVGVMYTAWQRGAETLRLYASYRDTFKPAAIDFGIGEEEGGEEEALLKPETSHSLEGGAKVRTLGGRLAVDAEAFLMDFSNLVVAQSVNGVPGLANAGNERFKGFETEATLALPRALTARATYAFHDAKFRDFVQDFDGVPTQLAGKRLEMSARHLASFGALYAPLHGLFGLAEVNYVGSRYLNKRNSALADAYTTLRIGAGWREGNWEARLDVNNVTDERPPVAESELGDAQYYLLPARRIELGLTRRF